MKKKNYIAVFDIDDTILRVNSSKIIALAAHRQGMMKTRDLLNGILHIFFYKYNLRDPLKIIDSMGEWVKGTEINRLRELVDSIFESEIVKAIRPEIIKEIKYHQSNNAETVILSSALSQICNPIASYLGFDHVLCSEIEEVDGKLTGRPIGHFCFGSEKLNRLKEFCFSNGYQLEDSWYYADSRDDFHVLEAVGYPVCVSPDRKLKKIAKERNWPVNLWD